MLSNIAPNMNLVQKVKVQDQIWVFFNVRDYCIQKQKVLHVNKQQQTQLLDCEWEQAWN